MKAETGCLLLVVSVVVIIPLRGLAIALNWDWFIAPVLHGPAISYLEGFGFALFWTTLTKPSGYKEVKLPTSEPERSDHIRDVVIQELATSYPQRRFKFYGLRSEPAHVLVVCLEHYLANYLDRVDCLFHLLPPVTRATMTDGKQNK
jgi:hypothetical protein